MAPRENQPGKHDDSSSSSSSTSSSGEPIPVPDVSGGDDLCYVHPSPNNASGELQTAKHDDYSDSGDDDSGGDDLCYVPPSPNNASDELKTAKHDDSSDSGDDSGGDDLCYVPSSPDNADDDLKTAKHDDSSDDGDDSEGDELEFQTAHNRSSKNYSQAGGSHGNASLRTAKKDSSLIYVVDDETISCRTANPELYDHQAHIQLEIEVDGKFYTLKADQQFQTTSPNAKVTPVQLRVNGKKKWCKGRRLMLVKRAKAADVYFLKDQSGATGGIHGKTQQRPPASK